MKESKEQMLANFEKRLTVLKKRWVEEPAKRYSIELQANTLKLGINMLKKKLNVNSRLV